MDKLFNPKKHKLKSHTLELPGYSWADKLTKKKLEKKPLKEADIFDFHPKKVKSQK